VNGIRPPTRWSRRAPLSVCAVPGSDL
jgi:hypothetical protein